MCLVIIKDNPAVVANVVLIFSLRQPLFCSSSIKAECGRFLFGVEESRAFCFMRVRMYFRRFIIVPDLRLICGGEIEMVSGSFIGQKNII